MEVSKIFIVLYEKMWVTLYQLKSGSYFIAKQFPDGSIIIEPIVEKEAWQLIK